MNFKINGKVPIQSNNPTMPIQMVDFPNSKTFKSLYGAKLSQASLDKYWDVLKARFNGATLENAGKPYSLTRERVRQIESKFIQLLTKHHKSLSATKHSL
jgi:DNA-directed RNA polymerase sigma subunit (sigma70/sigma32)